VCVCVDASAKLCILGFVSKYKTNKLPICLMSLLAIHRTCVIGLQCVVREIHLARSRVSYVLLQNPFLLNQGKDLFTYSMVQDII